MYALLRPYGDMLLEYYHQLRHQIPVISATTYYVTILGLCIPPIIALIFYEREQARLLAGQPKGCRKLGLKIDSNLLNEFDRKFSEGRPPSTEETSAEWWRLKSLWIYPVKGCKGVELNRGTIVSTGMEYDRQFTFAQLRSPFPLSAQTPDREKVAHKWEYITQKQFPRLANVRTEMWVPDQSVDTYATHEEDVESGGVIILSFPYQEPGWRGVVTRWGAALKGTTPEKQFRVPFDPSPVQVEKAGYSLETMTIWNHDITALNLEAEIPEELRYYLGISNKLALFRIDKLQQNQVTGPHIQSIAGFQDAYPIHLVNLATIRDIEANMDKKKDSPRLSAASFRANLIVTGPEPYHEDTWRRIKIGFYEYDVMYRTSPYQKSRAEGRPDEEGKDLSGRTIWNYRNADGVPGLDVSCLGMKMIPLAKEAALRVGDEIIVLEVAEYSVAD